MRKALMTMGLGEEHGAYLALSRSGFQEYADRHNYTYSELPILDPRRPASWFKVEAMRHYLDAYYDAVLWLDCDVVIVDGSEDIANHVPADAWQAMATHTKHHGTDLGIVPNCGVWFVRQPMIPVLQQAWSMTRYIHHQWWEQAAMHELMGFGPTTDALTPVAQKQRTPLSERTRFLDERWNCVDTENDDAACYFMHMAGLPHLFRLGEMEYWSKKAMVTT